MQCNVKHKRAIVVCSLYWRTRVLVFSWGAYYLVYHYYQVGLLVCSLY